MLTEAGHGEGSDGPAAPVVNGFFFLWDASSSLLVRHRTHRTVTATLFRGVVVLVGAAIFAAPATRVLQLKHMGNVIVCYLNKFVECSI